MSDESQTCVKIFVDESKLYEPAYTAIQATPAKRPPDAGTVATKWQLPFNVAKCKVLHIGATNRNCIYVHDVWLLPDQYRTGDTPLSSG